jgi:acetylornithine deacetylase/succinyl-diaminopimelate desuccinylase-like protein
MPSPRARPALLLHGHLDVVPAESEDWSVDPFGGEIRAGAVWGRGALDMKGNDGAMLAVARGLARDEFTPAGDGVLAFVADEEDGGHLGAGYLVRERAELLRGVSHAIGEGGGTLHRLPDGSRLYPVACAERGTAWIELTAHGTAGHGSRPRGDNAVSVLAGTIAELAAIRWPVRLIAPVKALLDGVAERLGVELDPHDPSLVERLGEIGEVVGATLSNSLSPTMLSAGYAANVVPSSAVGVLDGRMLPGYEGRILRRRRGRAARRGQLPAAERRAADLGRPEGPRARADRRRDSESRPRRAGAAVLCGRRHRREVVHPARDRLLRVRTRADGPGL